MLQRTSIAFLTAVVLCQSSPAQCNVSNQSFDGVPPGTPVGSLTGWNTAGLIPPTIEIASQTTSESIALSGATTTRATRNLPTGIFETFRIKFDINTEASGEFRLDCPSATVRRAAVNFDIINGTLTSLTTGATLPMVIGCPVPMEIEATVQGLVEIHYDGALLDQFQWTNAPGQCDFATSFTFFSFTGGPSNDFIFVDNVCVETQVGTDYCTTVPNSTGVSTLLVARGSSSLAFNSLRLRTRDLPLNQFGFYLVGNTQGIFSPPGSQGNICLLGNVGLYQSTLLNSGTTGLVFMDLDLAATLPTSAPTVIQPGDTWNFQFWHRDVLPGGGKTSNLSNPVSILFEN